VSFRNKVGKIELKQIMEDLIIPEYVGEGKKNKKKNTTKV